MTRLTQAELTFSRFDPSPQLPPAVSSPPIELTWLIEECDPDGNGVIDQAHFNSCAIKRGIDPAHTQHIFERCDTDGDGALTHADAPNGDNRLDLASTLNNNGPKRPYFWSQANGEAAREALQRQARWLEKKLDAVSFSEKRLSNGLSFYNIELPLEDLPAQFEGLRILHLSDTHLIHEEDRNLNQLKHIVAALPEQVDIVIATGDFVDHALEGLGSEALELLSRITARSALSLAVLGNHDAKDGKRAKVMEALCTQAGFTDLTNASVRLALDGAGINIHGVDDYLTGQPVIPSIDRSRIREPHILITHNLDVLTKAYPHCMDLVLSGHLHSGEINLGFFDGVDWLISQGGYENLNEQKRGLKPLSWRTLSYISPGLATHNHHRFGVERAGVSMITLRNWHEDPPA